MAEGGFLNSSESVDSLDKRETVKCDPCLEDEKSVVAFGYCVTCDDYLCEHCFNHHLVPKPCRDHILQDLAKVTNAADGGFNGRCFLSCFKHQNRQAIFYSKSKDKCYCEACTYVIEEWAQKGDLVEIQELAKGIKESEEFKSFIEKVKSTRTHFKTKQLHTQAIEGESEEYYESLKVKLINEIDTMKDEDLSEVKTLSEKCASAVGMLDRLVEKSEEFQHEDTCLYALMKLNSKEVSGLAKDMLNMKVERIASRPKIVDLATGEILRQVMSSKPLCFVDRETQTALPIKRPGKFISCLCLKGPDETPTYHKAGMILLGNNRLLISEYELNTLTLVNTDTLSVVTQLRLDCQGPHEMTIIDNTHVYVTIPDQQRIINVHVTASQLHKMTEFKTDGKCFTLARSDNLKCQFYNPCKLLETDLNGHAVRTIRKNLSDTKDEKGNPVITNPVHSLFVRKNGSMYVSCWNRNTILEIKHGGQGGLLVTSSNLAHPRAMVMDSDGSILVCSYGRQTVLRVTITGEILDDILPDRLDFHPLSLALDESTRKLYVAGTSENVQVYQI